MPTGMQQFLIAWEVWMKVSELNELQKNAVHSAGKKPEVSEKVTVYPGSNSAPQSLRLQYEYELERGREISSSVTRLVVLIPMMIAAVGLIVLGTVTWCTRNISAHVFIILGTAAVIVLLCALAVVCTVHFYILNPAPTQPGEDEWLARMKHDLQRGNNWRGWLVFAATILIYAAGGVILAILILGLIGM